MGEISDKQLRDTFKLYQKHKDTNLFKYVLCNAKYFNTAKNILKQTNNPFRSLDAIHLGIIYSENLTLFSFDEVMNQTAKEFNIPVFEA